VAIMIVLMGVFGALQLQVTDLRVSVGKLEAQMADVASRKSAEVGLRVQL
jgi:hypothetical protein